MKIELTSSMMTQWDVLAEFDPPQVLQEIDNYSQEKFTSKDWNRIMYFKGKALSTINETKEAEEIAISCIRDSIVEKDFYTLVKCYILQAICYYRTDSEDEIKPLLDIALEYAIESGDYELLIHAYCANMYYLRHHSQFEEALRQEMIIEDLIHRVPHSYTTTSALGSIALLFVDMSKWDLSIKYFMEALEQAQSLSLDIFQLSLLNNLGSAVHNIRDYPKAEIILKQGLSLAKKKELKRQEFQFTFNLGSVKTEEAKYIEALEYYDKCMKILENIHPSPPYQLMDLYNNYSFCYWQLKETDKSLSYLDKALQLAQECGFERDQIQMEVNKTNLLVEMGNYEEALAIAKRGIQYYKKANDLHQLMWVYRTMSKIYFLKKDYHNSFDTDRKLDDITEDYITDILKREVATEIANIEVPNATNFDFQEANYRRTQINSSHGFIGSSKAAQKVLNSALLAAQYHNTSVLILGESGTGKEIIAQIIHKNSLRRNKPFIPVNVGALTSSLVESELFGHTKGAFTGADNQTKGFFLQADKGTLFLDEITDMPFAVQSKLLRALETKKITAVGCSKETPYDSRVISATSQDIRAQLSKSQFRLDLFHRLNTIEIVIPPLRERIDDIEPILYHFLNHYAKELNKSIPFIDRSLLQMLHTYTFPGNVRELKNIVERMYILSKKKEWDVQLLCEINPFRFEHSDFNPLSYNEEEDIIVKALIRAKGKQKEAARLLNMSEATFYRRVVKYKLQKYTKKGMNGSS